MTIRKALLVGINAYPHAPLQGCLNDVRQMQDLLTHYYNFQKQDMRTLLEEEATSAAITAGLEWLAEGGDDPDAVRVFHYSGHGSYVADRNGDEPDGRDECLVPVDYETVGMLTDDALKALYDRFPRTGNLSLVMDCCHSGSNQKAPGDICYRFIPASLEENERGDAAAAKFAEDQQEFVTAQILKLRDPLRSEAELRQKIGQLMGTFKKRRFGDIRVREANVLLAGCRPDQQCADAPIAGEYHGAFTYYLAEAIQQANGRLTYRQLADGVGRGLYGHDFIQIPQLECLGSRRDRPAFGPFL